MGADTINTDFLTPTAATITAGNSATIEQGKSSIFIQNSPNSSGNVTIQYWRKGTAHTSFTLEPGLSRSYGSQSLPYDKMVITCATGTTCYYEYLN